MSNSPKCPTWGDVVEWPTEEDVKNPAEEDVKKPSKIETGVEYGVECVPGEGSEPNDGDPTQDEDSMGVDGKTAQTGEEAMRAVDGVVGDAMDKAEDSEEAMGARQIVAKALGFRLDDIVSAEIDGKTRKFLNAKIEVENLFFTVSLDAANKIRIDKMHLPDGSILYCKCTEGIVTLTKQVLKDGTTIEGEFAGDFLNLVFVEGTVTYPDGRTQKGRFDQSSKELTLLDGTEHCPDGSKAVYEGGKITEKYWKSADIFTIGEHNPENGFLRSGKILKSDGKTVISEGSFDDFMRPLADDQGENVEG